MKVIKLIVVVNVISHFVYLFICSFFSQLLIPNYLGVLLSVWVEVIHIGEKLVDIGSFVSAYSRYIPNLSGFVQRKLTNLFKNYILQTHAEV